MKNFTFIIIILLCRISNVTAQNINLSEEEVNSILCHSWRLSSATIDGQPIPIHITFEIQFNKDNTYFLLSNPDAIGTWSYNPEEKYIELKTNNRKAKIGTLSKKEMIFTEQNTDVYGNVASKKSEFHLIRNE